MRRWLLLFVCSAPLVCLVGCNKGPKLAPLSGTVKLDGNPLEFGVVMLQPASGQPSRAEIRPDGTFEMSTFREGDGATVGLNKVRVACFESQQPNRAASEGEQSLGKLLIPRRFTLFDQSGLSVTVLPSDNPPLILDLTTSN